MNGRVRARLRGRPAARTCVVLLMGCLLMSTPVRPVTAADLGELGEITATGAGNVTCVVNDCAVTIGCAAVATRTQTRWGIWTPISTQIDSC